MIIGRDQRLIFIEALVIVQTEKSCHQTNTCARETFQAPQNIIFFNLVTLAYGGQEQKTVN